MFYLSAILLWIEQVGAKTAGLGVDSD